MLSYPIQNGSSHRPDFALLCEQLINAVISYLEKCYLNKMYFKDSIILKKFYCLHGTLLSLKNELQV